MQAPVKALDPDGKLVLIIGTSAFAIASIVCGILYPFLATTDQLWRFWVALFGTALGVLALVALAVKGRRQSASRESTSDTPVTNQESPN